VHSLFECMHKMWVQHHSGRWTRTLNPHNSKNSIPPETAATRCWKAALVVFTLLHVCTWACACVCIKVYMCMRACMCAWAHACACASKCTCACMCVRQSIHVHACVYMGACVCVCAKLYTYMYVCMRQCIRVCIRGSCLLLATRESVASLPCLYKSHRVWAHER